jgi:hypothetical protein
MRRLPDRLGERLPEHGFIRGKQASKLATNQALFDRGEHGLTADGLTSPAVCHWLIQTSPKATERRSWLVTAITTTSGRTVL